MEFYCIKCDKKIAARLTDGAEIYPHRLDLSSLPFWKCDICENYIGCHYKTDNPTAPLGKNIPSVEIKKARREIHKILDPIWQSKKITRKKLYKLIAKRLGRKSYHTANLIHIKDARKVYKVVAEINNKLNKLC